MKKIKKMIAKFLDLPTTEDIDALTSEVFQLSSLHDATQKEMQGMRADFRTLKSDMKALYGEVSSDIKRVDGKIGRVKPTLKVEDPEAVAFIKGILSKHDTNIGTQQVALQSKILQLKEVEERAKNAVEVSEKASLKINNLLNGLGLTEVTPEGNGFSHLKDLLKEREVISSNA